MKKGPFEVTESKQVYKNPWIELTQDKVIRPNGKEGMFGVVNAGEGVNVLALDKNNQVYLIYEYHYAIEKYEYILPSGGIDKNETPLEAAKRELKEEAGLEAKKWTYLGSFNPLTMIVSATNHSFLAEDLTAGKQTDEEQELLKVKRFPFAELFPMIERGEMSHSGTVIAVLKTARIKNL